MHCYKTGDGILIRSNTAEGVVRKLRSHSHEPGAGTMALRTFMGTISDRVLAQCGAGLDCSNFNTFVAGLVQAGLLKEEHNA